MKNYVDESVTDDCFNGFESFGVVCVHCGCCAEEPSIRYRARLELFERELKYFQNFQYSDVDSIAEIQKSKVNETIEYINERIKYYGEKVKNK